MAEPFDIFLSYSRNDLDAAVLLQTQLERARLKVFRDEKGIRWSDPWLDRLQDAVATCKRFVVLIGKDGVGRWIGAETQVALKRYFGPHSEDERLPIFPILLGERPVHTLPAFLQLFQSRTWNGDQPLPDELIEAIRSKEIGNGAPTIDRCPFLGLNSFGPDDANLFFGRQNETLDALACFNTRKEPFVRWLEISGNSGCGKSSLMNAGLLPLVEKGWLWPRTGYERWTCIGPMMPGAQPVRMLAEALVHAFRAAEPQLEMPDVRRRLDVDDDLALADWLRTRKKRDAAFLLAIDQFEELFTIARADEKQRFQRQLAAALMDPDCPLFVVSTIRADFLDRYEDIRELAEARNYPFKPWTLLPIGPQGLREVIEEPARLAGVKVHEVKGLLLDQARGEPGALPLVENALEWLWNSRTDNRLCEQRFREAGGLAGILSHSADELLSALSDEDRTRALELLFRLVKVDVEGVRHARQPLLMEDAMEAAGGGERGRALLDRLAGRRVPGSTLGPVRLITITDQGTDEGRWVNLIHETLIRSKGFDEDGKPQPYWPTLWTYIEQHKEHAALRERLRSDMRTWLENNREPGFQWSHERVRELHRVMQRPGPKFELKPGEREFLGPIQAEEMLAELEQAEATHQRRLLIGQRLAMLGEHPSRWGVGVDEQGTPRIDWCSVPGGEVTISILSDPNNALSEVAARLPRKVSGPRVGRYPVTVAQYRAFIDADDGWRDAKWWGDDLYRDEDGKTYEFGRFGNHPAVYVSWFDAVAFCRWLSHRLEFSVRLPDEWEWQQAATGGDEGNVFPWGGDWDAKQEPWRANTFESRLGQVTAVGMYPAGATTPTQILDMAGTVWEWCLNKFDRDKVEETRSGARDFDPRVLRGGSWGDDQDYARSAYRYWGNPVNRSYDIGFRVVCSSPSSGH